MIQDALLQNRIPDFNLLTKFGFVLHDRVYTYSAPIFDGQFKMVVSVTAEGLVSAPVYDSDNGEEYVLHQTSASGKFVGQVRSEYLGILQNVVENCFVKKIFQTAQATQIIDYIRQKYHNELEYLWNKFPEDAVIRRRDNRKWYAVFMVIDGTKLGLKSGRIEVMDLRAAPDNINNLIDRQTYFAGYHMNKQHWITVVLDKSAPLPKILQLLDTSYNLASKK